LINGRYTFILSAPGIILDSGFLILDSWVFCPEQLARRKTEKIVIKNFMLFV
jgi:hypothetical protein